MTPKPQNWKDLPATTTSAHRALVTALREVRVCSSRTQAEIARDAHQAATTLSNHLNGGRIPEEALLRGFYAAVEKDVAGREHLPHSLDALLEMRIHAQKKHCECCSVGFPTASGEHRVDPGDPQDQERPASAIVQDLAARRRGLRRLRKPRMRRFSTRREREKVPVPLGEGDRHLAKAAELTWTETKVVARYLADGRNRDADLLLWKAGTSYSPDDVLMAVTACHSAGLRDAAEAILINAAGRPDKQAVLNVTAVLDRAGRHEDASFLLAAAHRASS
ncbi:MULTISPECIES: hypothetical protein [unclassified Streptomyces]|uniref:hypothetical protein n=1 Tax=unclassified Streptomyces TaxID=2593676 RepID=UPI00341DEFE5